MGKKNKQIGKANGGGGKNGLLWEAGPAALGAFGAGIWDSNRGQGAATVPAGVAMIAGYAMKQKPLFWLGLGGVLAAGYRQGFQMGPGLMGSPKATSTPTTGTAGAQANATGTT